MYIEKQYQIWKQNVKSSGIKSFQKIVKMIDYHFDSIIEYFYRGLTNVMAENINNRIQRLLPIIMASKIEISYSIGLESISL
ncbi:MAG: transposase [Chitinophagales bacterium]